MPSFELVKGLAHSYIEKGIDPSEANALHQYILDGRGEPTDRHITQLVRLSETFADHFTPNGAEAWRRATGIVVRQGNVEIPKALKARVLAQTELRAMVARDRAWLAEAYPVKASSRSVDVTPQRLAFNELSSRTATAVEHASLSFDEAIALNPPGKLLRAALHAPGARVVERVLSEVTDLERRHGDNNGKLVPRDVKHAPRRLQQVMDAVYQQLGRRELSLEQIRTALPDALEAVVWGGKSKSNRKQEHLRGLYTAVAEECLTHFASRYRREITEGSGHHLQFVESMGFMAEVDKTRVTMLAQTLMAPPTLDEMQALYAKAIAGTLGSKDFYNAARIDAADVWMLQARLPKEFPRVEGQKETQALGAAKAVRSTTTSPEALSEAWLDEVVQGDKTVERFCIDHDVRIVVFSRLRKAHPSLFPAKEARPANEAIAPALSQKLQALAQAHPFDKVPGLLERLNADTAFTARFGTINYLKYYAVRKENPELFGRIDGSDRWRKPIGDAVVRLAAEHPEWSRAEMVTALQETWPEMTYSRLSRLKDDVPSLPVPGAYNRRSADDIDRIAHAIAEEKSRDPEQTATQIAARLSKKKKFGAIDAAYVNSIIRDFRPGLFVKVDGISEGTRIKQRRNIISRLLVHAAIRTLPPGTKSELVLERYNKLLVERGLTPTTAGNWAATLNDASSATGAGVLDDYNAKVTREIIAEYTAAAKKTDTADTILARVRRDYPTLTPHALGRYRAITARRGTEKATPPTQQRWLGGFDLRRVITSATEAEQKEWARMSEALHVPLRLPELDALIASLDGSKPLQGANVVWVTHVLADIPAMALAMREAGAAASRMQIVGSPYGTSGLVADALDDMGMKVARPALSVEAYKKAVEEALDRAAAAHRKNGEPIYVIDDGGLVSELLNTKAKYKDIVGKVRGVEQTTGGVVVAEKHALKNLVVAFARSESKRYEGAAIGEVVAQKMVQALRRESDGLEGKAVLVMGFGIIGPAIAAEIERAGGIPTIVEPGKENAARVPKRYAKVTGNPESEAYLAARRKALQGTDILLGATGRNSTTLADLKLLKKGAKVASASSKRVELDMVGLQQASTKRTVLPSKNPITTLPTARYQGNGFDVTVIGDGWPLNFDGGVQSVPPEKIQLTDAGLLAAVFQASRSVGQTGLVDFDKDTDQVLLARHRGLEKTFKMPVYDPDRWIDALVALTEAAVAA